jgi:Acetyltransferase (GNAT) family
MNIVITRAVAADLPGLVSLSREFACESGPAWVSRFDPSHAEQHMRHLVEDGVCIVAKKGDTVIGVIACMPIDVGFTRISDLETAHIYIHPSERTQKVIFDLFKMVKEYAVSHGLKVLFHQANYPAVIDGRESNGRRVETLFKRYVGGHAVDCVVAFPDFVRVGITYLYDGLGQPAQNGDGSSDEG